MVDIPIEIIDPIFRRRWPIIITFFVFASNNAFQYVEIWFSIFWLNRLLQMKSLFETLTACTYFDTSISTSIESCCCGLKDDGITVSYRLYAFDLTELYDLNHKTAYFCGKPVGKTTGRPSKGSEPLWFTWTLDVMRVFWNLLLNCLSDKKT